jgi:hypothetical protein
MIVIPAFGKCRHGRRVGSAVCDTGSHLVVLPRYSIDAGSDHSGLSAPVWPVTRSSATTTGHDRTVYHSAPMPLGRDTPPAGSTRRLR